MSNKKCKIMLIEPPFYRLFKDTYSLSRYPLSLGYLAEAVQKYTDWDVLSYNADFNPHEERMQVSYLAGVGFYNYRDNLTSLSTQVWQEIRAAIIEYEPDVVGISAKSQNFISACRVAKIAKIINKQMTVILGGPHASMVGAEALSCEDIDVAVMGEGEKTLVELLGVIAQHGEYNNINGICYRKGDRVITNLPREFIKDMDSLPFPHENAQRLLKDYHLYPLSAFQSIFATRGCPYNCFFCGSRKIWSRTPRFRSPDNVVQEVKQLQRLGVLSVTFEDDTFGINREYIKALCSKLGTDCPTLKWRCELHVKLIDDEIISAMKKAGCYSISIGVESGNNQILKEIRKNITIEEAFRAAEIVKKHDIEASVFFMIGFPQETESTLNDTMLAMRRIKSDSLFYSIFTPYPGTEAFVFCQEKGLIKEDYDLSMYNHQSPFNCFSLNISLEKFRKIASSVEKMVDRANWFSRIRRIFSINTIWRIRELGVGRSLEKGFKILIKK